MLQAYFWLFFFFFAGDAGTLIFWKFITDLHKIPENLWLIENFRDPWNSQITENHKSVEVLCTSYSDKVKSRTVLKILHSSFPCDSNILCSLYFSRTRSLQSVLFSNTITPSNCTSYIQFWTNLPANAGAPHTHQKELDHQQIAMMAVSSFCVHNTMTTPPHPDVAFTSHNNPICKSII